MTDDPRLPATTLRVLGEGYHPKGLAHDPGPPIPYVAEGLMHPVDITVVYGRGGSGKGFVSVYVARALVREGFYPLVLDFEKHEYEWQSRTFAMGLIPDSVGYLEMDETFTANVAKELRHAIQRDGYTHVIIDSISQARQASRANDAGGADVATDFMRNVRYLQMPSWCIAHEGRRGGGGPIGSVQYFDQARVVYRVTRDHSVVTMEREKASDQPDEQYLATFRWEGKDFNRQYVAAIKAEPEKEGVKEACVRVLQKTERAMGPSDIQHFLHVFEDNQVDATVINVMLGRLVKEGVIIKEGRGKYRYPLPQVEIEPN